MLAPVLLERLRAWWRWPAAQGKMLDGGCMFPGLHPIESPLAIVSFNRDVNADAKAAADRQARSGIRCATVRNAPARAEGRYPRHPGPARAPEARDHPRYTHGHRELREVVSTLETMPPRRAHGVQRLLWRSRRFTVRRGSAWRRARQEHLSLGQLKVM